MTDVRVFFEPKVAPHDPALYAFERTDPGVPAAALAGGEEALARYREEGFLTVRGLLTRDEVDAARAELGAMTLADPPGCAMIWYEGAIRDRLALDPSRDREIDARAGGVRFAAGQEGPGLPDLDPAERARFVRKLMGFVGPDRPALAHLARHPALTAIVGHLVGGAPELFQDMALIKPAQGREKPWHQDHAYFNLALDTPVVGVWIPMGEVTPENGCMHMLAGGHKVGPRPHYKRRDWQLCDDHVEAAGRVAVPMAPGDALLFDGKIPHGTPVNRTGEHRWAVQFHYRPAAALAVGDEARLAAFGSEGLAVTC